MRLSDLIERYRGLLKPLLLACLALLLATLFLTLASEIREGETHAFDMAVLQQAMAARAAHPWLAEVMRDLSGLGSTVTLTLLTVATCGYLWLIGRWTLALLVGASIASAAALVSVLKTGFARGRPDAAFAELVQSGLSFPSGHASMSAAVFLTLAALLASIHVRIGERIYLLSSAAALTLLVGVSRIALGVHWATDVLGGWAFGTAWAAGWLLLAARLQQAHRPAGTAG